MDNDLQVKDWREAFSHTIQICDNDENYAAYSVREKLLAFTFTFIQSIEENRAYFSGEISRNRISCMKSVKGDMLNYFETLLWEGSNTGEIQSRLYLSSYYKNACWNMLMAVVNFWENDSSPNKERTDVFIEKSVHFTVDLLSPNALDTGFDLIQQLLKWR